MLLRDKRSTPKMTKVDFMIENDGQRSYKIWKPLPNALQ